MITVLLSVPSAIMPQIRALLPPSTRRRVEIFPKAPGVTSGVGEGVGGGEIVEVAVAVAVAVGVGVGV